MLEASSGTSFGTLLRTWRKARGHSQQALSEAAHVSPRHLSCVETGRAQPSRAVVLALARELGVPLRARNALLQAAGHAPIYRETPLEAEALGAVRDAVRLMLVAHEPNPAMLVNHRYDVLMANQPAIELLAFFAPTWRGKNNVACMLAAPHGLRTAIENWPEIARAVFHHLLAELAGNGARSAQDRAMLDLARAMVAELSGAEHAADAETALNEPPAVLVPLKLRRDDVSLNLFTAITTLGTPLDITLQEMRIETLFPADERSRVALRDLCRRGARSHAERIPPP